MVVENRVFTADNGDGVLVWLFLGFNHDYPAASRRVHRSLQVAGFNLVCGVEHFRTRLGQRIAKGKDRSKLQLLRLASCLVTT